MGYTDDDWFEADATGAFPAFGRPGAGEVRYADSGLLPDDVPPADDAWLPEAGRAADRGRVPGSAPAADGSRPGAGTRVAHGREIAHESPLTDAGRHARDSRLVGSDRLAEDGGDAESGLPGSGFPVDAFPAVGTYPDGRLPAAGRDVDGDTGDADSCPVVDWYAGYEQFAAEPGDRAGQPQAAAEDEPLVRAYARPTDPWEAAGFAGQPPVTSQPPAAAQPLGDHLDSGYPDELSLADYAARSSLAERIVRLRPDRWLIAGGGLAAAAAVVVAFLMAGGSGSAATPGSGGTAQTGTMQTATAHATRPVCVTPAPGH